MVADIFVPISSNILTSKASLLLFWDLHFSHRSMFICKGPKASPSLSGWMLAWSPGLYTFVLLFVHKNEVVDICSQRIHHTCGGLVVGFAFDLDSKCINGSTSSWLSDAFISFFMFLSIDSYSVSSTLNSVGLWTKGKCGSVSEVVLMINTKRSDVF